MVLKAKPIFISVLGIVSIMGFLGVLFDSVFNLNVDAYISSLIFVVIGIGLMFEGGVRNIRKMLERGITRDETTHMLAIIVGAMAVVLGGLSMPGVAAGGELFHAMKGLLSVFAIAIIAVETWLVK